VYAVVPIVMPAVAGLLSYILIDDSMNWLTSSLSISFKVALTLATAVLLAP
jgi:hypothetical protein